MSERDTQKSEEIKAFQQALNDLSDSTTELRKIDEKLGALNAKLAKRDYRISNRTKKMMVISSIHQAANSSVPTVPAAKLKLAK